MSGRTGGASCNRKHCKPKGKHPGRGFGKYQRSFRILRKHLADSRCVARGQSRLAPPPSLICTVMLSLQTPALLLHPCCDACPCRCGCQPFGHLGSSQEYAKADVFVHMIILNSSLLLIVSHTCMFWAFWGMTGSIHVFLRSIDMVMHGPVFCRLQGLFCCWRYCPVCYEPLCLCRGQTLSSWLSSTTLTKSWIRWPLSWTASTAERTLRDAHCWSTSSALVRWVWKNQT